MLVICYHYVMVTFFTCILTLCQVLPHVSHDTAAWNTNTNATTRGDAQVTTCTVYITSFVLNPTTTHAQHLWLSSIMWLSVCVSVICRVERAVGGKMAGDRSLGGVWGNIQSNQWEMGVLTHFLSHLQKPYSAPQGHEHRWDSRTFKKKFVW